MQNESGGFKRATSIKRGSWFNPETLANQKVLLSYAVSIKTVIARLLLCRLSNVSLCNELMYGLSCMQREWGQQFKDKSKIVEWPEHNFEHFIVVVSCCCLA